MSNSIKRSVRIFLFTAVILLSGILLPNHQAEASSGSQSAILLNTCRTTMRIGDQKYLTAYTASGKKATFQSSRPSIVSVDLNGKMTARSAGTAIITARIGNAKASCTVTVEKTRMTINASSVSIERKGSYRLRASASIGTRIVWKSNKPWIATVSPTGVVNGIQPGEAIISAMADGTAVSCKVTVKKPIVKLSQSSITLAPGQSARIVATVSSGLKPIWTSGKTSVATVSENGTVTAHAPGKTTITASIDGVKKVCTVTVTK